jgi:hypothetical protein
MTWTKLSDDFADDCWSLSAEAFRLHTEGLVWSNRKLLDCRIPESDVRRFARHPQAIDELLAVGWWVADGDHYVIRHHARYQRERSRVLNQQAVNKANALKGGRPPKPSREVWPETESVSESASDSQSEMDRTGQDRTGTYGESTKPHDGTSGSGTRCDHGVVGGKLSDPWLSGRLACPECAREAAP